MAGYKPQPQNRHIWGQPRNGFSPLLSALRGVSPLLSHHLLPLLALLSITWGAAPSSVRLLWVPVCPTALTTLWDCAGLHQHVLAETPSPALGLSRGGDTGLMVPQGLLAHPCPGHTAGMAVAPGMWSHISYPPKPRCFAGRECCHRW